MEITIGNIIKIILALVVVGAAAYGLYYVFSNNVFDSFGDLGVTPEMILPLL